MLIFAVLATSAVMWSRAPRQRSAPPTILEGDVLTRLERRFGSTRHSQGPEEWIVREFFNDMKSGVFLDVGAYRASSGATLPRSSRT